MDFRKQLVGNIEIARAEKEIAASKTSSGEPEIRLRKISVFEQLMNPTIWIAAAGQVFLA